MIAEVNVEFFDKYGNDYTETLEIPIDDDENESNVEAIIEDAINKWFIETAQKIFSTIVPKYILEPDYSDIREDLFEKYFDNAEFFSDLL